MDFPSKKLLLREAESCVGEKGMRRLAMMDVRSSPPLLRGGDGKKKLGADDRSQSKRSFIATGIAVRKQWEAP
jgi:hypothetical protein